jgi:hypothetical protein
VRKQEETQREHKKKRSTKTYMKNDRRDEVKYIIK